MIFKVTGDLLRADVEALVNTVNTVGVMGRGVALQFKRLFPENFRAYERACARGEVRIGSMFVYDLSRLKNPRYVINFPTKEHWRGKSRYEYVEHGLADLAQVIQRLGIQSIALPPLGCGLGGLDWNKVYHLIERVLGDMSNVRVLVYEPAGPPRTTEMTTGTRRPSMTAGRAALLALMKRYLDPLMDDSITLLEIHKLMYFMQAAGEPLRLKYVKGVYGPYAENLHHVLERIEGHFISGYGDGREAPGKVIEYIENAVVEAEATLMKKTQTHARLERIQELISGFETPYGMELLASTHWVATEEDTHAGEDSSVAVQLIHSWNSRKRRLFKAEHIESARVRLREQAWL